MKKLLLPISVIFLSLLATAFLLPQEINAQKTDPECFREYQNKEYKCLQKFNDCTKPCTSLGSVEDSDSCRDKCSAQDKTCSEQASADLTACKAAIPKNKEEIASEDKSAQDCRKIFDKESYKCLTDSNACPEACMKETEKPDGSAYFNSGEIYSKCTKERDCDGKSKACNDRALANFRACGKSDNQSKTAEIEKETPKQDQNSPFVPVLNLMSTDYITVSYLEPSERPPTVTAEDEKEALISPQYIGEKMRVLGSGSVQYKSSVTGEWADLQPEISFPERSMVSGDWLKLRLDIGLSEKVPAVLSLSDFQAKVDSSSVDLLIGEIEFKSRGDKEMHSDYKIKTDNAEITTKDTHFWVSYDKDKKQTLVGVYNGEVEVKTSDGKTTKVKPDGDKPGVAVISQKLSPVKLAIVGLVLAGAIGGILFFKRKKRRK